MENKEVTLVLNLEKVNILLSGLGELPSKISYELIMELHRQVSEQLKPQPEGEKE